MTPGGSKKKKGTSQKNPHGKPVTENPNSNLESSKTSENIEFKLTSSDKNVKEDIFRTGKYKKRELVSNWDRYNEPVEDKYGDHSRGSDYEKVLSYSGGAGSQMRFQSERDWDKSEYNVDIVFDMNCFSQAVKCIPFHKRHFIPEDIFDTDKRRKFEEIAENHKRLFLAAKDN